MPHQCTNCSLTFEDGSKQMLGGCPECGGNKFQFLPAGKSDRSGSDADSVRAGGAIASSPSTSPPPSASSPPADEPRIVGHADGSSIDRFPSDDDIIEAPAEPIDPATVGEDRAQATARREVVSEDELPAVDADDDPIEPEANAPGEDRPDLTQLRQELNDQFESIKILRPGEYELNLMELYDRQEYIIALEEDGRYVIDVPDTWRDER